MDDGLTLNQTRSDSGGSTLYLLAEGLVFLLSLLRIFVVAVVLAVNIIALRRSSRMNGSGVSTIAPSTGGIGKCHCLHLYVSDSVKICSIIYIVTWTPFLIYSLLNGRWLIIDEQIFCVLQNYLTNAILLVLLAMAALLGYTKIAEPRPKAAAALTLAGWILPQLAFFIILTTLEESGTSNANKLDFDFLDDLMSDNGQKSGATSLGVTYKIGFTICGQNLCSLALTQYILQYVVIILPLCIISTLVFIRHLCVSAVHVKSHRHFHNYSELISDEKPSTGDRHTGCHCVKGAESPALEIILGIIVVWMTLVRPFVLFMWAQDRLFIDLGSHLMLTIAAVFAPILPHQLFARQVNVYRIGSSSLYMSSNEHYSTKPAVKSSM